MDVSGSWVKVCGVEVWGCGGVVEVDDGSRQQTIGSGSADLPGKNEQSTNDGPVTVVGGGWVGGGGSLNFVFTYPCLARRAGR